MEAALLTVDELVPQYQLVVDRQATLVRLEVHVEPSAAFVAACGGFRDDHPAAAALRERVERQLHDRLGLSVVLRLVAPQTLPRSEGKAVRVVERA